MREEAISTLPAPADSATATAAPAAEAARAPGLATWGARGGLALADQGLFAGAHFLLSILLARWLAPADYGAFALGYSVFLLVSAVHGALLLEPMAVFGSGKYLPDWRSYLGILLRGHLALTATAAVLVFAAANFVARFEAPAVEQTLLVLAPVIPLLLLVWLTRRAFYFRLLPGWAAAGSAVYFAVLLASAVWLYGTGKLSLVTAILAMALAAALAATVQLARLRPRWTHGEALAVSDVAREHWRYGRWALASTLSTWTMLNLYYFALPAWSGLEGPATLKALHNLVQPALHTMIALSALLVPVLVRRCRIGGIQAMRQTVVGSLVLFASGSLSFLLLILAVHDPIFRILYNGQYGDPGAGMVLLTASLAVAAGPTVVLASALQALERPEWVFRSYGFGCLVALGVGLPLAAKFGVQGALTGLLLSYAATAAAMAIFLLKTRNQSRSSNHVGGKRAEHL